MQHPALLHGPVQKGAGDKGAAHRLLLGVHKHIHTRPDRPDGVPQLQVLRSAIGQIPLDHQKIKVGAMGEREVGELNKIMVADPTIFTKENVDQFDF